MNTLTLDSTPLTLDDDLLWTDEYAWSKVQQQVDYTVTGAAVVQASARQAGRPMTLEGGADFAWLDRDTVDALEVLKRLPGAVFALAFRGGTYSVVFDHGAGAMEAAPVVDFADPNGTDWYIVKLRFLQV